VAKFVNKTSVITVNGVDLSDHVSSVNVTSEKERVDVTGMTSSAYREETDGFATAEMTFTLFQDYRAPGAGAVDATLYPLYTSGSIHDVSVKPESGGTVVWHLPQAKIYNYNPQSGGVGDASSFDVTFSNAGTAGLTRGTV
jgi:hypothetical protein